MDRRDVEEVARMAARNAVAEMMIALGINVKDPASILRVQRNFTQLHEWVAACDDIKKHSMTTTVGILIVGLIGAVLMYAKDHLGWK